MPYQFDVHYQSNGIKYNGRIVVITLFTVAATRSLRNAAGFYHFERNFIIKLMPYWYGEALAEED